MLNQRFGDLKANWGLVLDQRYCSQIRGWRFESKFAGFCFVWPDTAGCAAFLSGVSWRPDSCEGKIRHRDPCDERHERSTPAFSAPFQGCFFFSQILPKVPHKVFENFLYKHCQFSKLKGLENVKLYNFNDILKEVIVKDPPLFHCNCCPANLLLSKLSIWPKPVTTFETQPHTWGQTGILVFEGVGVYEAFRFSSKFGFHSFSHCFTASQLFLQRCHCIFITLMASLTPHSELQKN